MKFLRNLFDFYIKSSIHIGFEVLCLVYITTISNDLRIHIVYPSCVFFGTILGYNFLKYFEIFIKKRSDRNKYCGIWVISIVAGLGFLFFFLWLKRSVQIHILISGLFVLMYPFLRKLGWLKLFLVSFVVTYVTVYIPFYIQNNSSTELYINLIQRFLILVSLLIPFEIMDSKTDAKTMNTLPQLFGITRTKIFGILLVIPFMVLEFLKDNAGYVVLPIGIITVLFINFTTLKKSKYYTSFWVESVPILWWILLIVL